MAVDGLHPELERRAAAAGQQAAIDRKAGRIPTPCRWAGDDRSLTARRMAGVWARAYAAATPEPNPLPE